MNRKNKFLAILAGVGVVIAVAALILLFIWGVMASGGNLIIAIAALIVAFWLLFGAYMAVWSMFRWVYKKVYRYLTLKQERKNWYDK